MDELRKFMIERRAQLGISQAELAKRAGVPSGTVAAIEIGRVDNAPRVDTLQKLAKGLNVPVQQLVSIALGMDTEKIGKGVGEERVNDVAQRIQRLSEAEQKQVERFLRLLEEDKES